MGRLADLFVKIGFDRFAAKFMRAIREAGERDELRFEAAERRILRLHDGEVAEVINLGNMYGNYRRLPRVERTKFLRMCVRTALAPHRVLPGEFDAACPDLRPRIWARSALEQERLRGLLGDASGRPVELLSEPVGEHLLAFLGYDWPESVQSLKAEDLAGWRVTFYEAMEVARQNLEEATAMFSKVGESLYCFTSGDSYDASRLTLINRIHALEVAGKPVAMVPSREHLYITGSEDDVGLAMMVELAEKALDQP
jgi:hypothetical protein